MGASSVPPQLGVAYLATSLRRAGHRVGLVHADRTAMTEAAFVERVLADRPDVLGLTVVTMAYNAVRRICAALRARGFGGAVILGGPHATALPELSLRETGAVAVITGEGETSTPALVAALASSSKTGLTVAEAQLDPAVLRLLDNARGLRQVKDESYVRLANAQVAVNSALSYIDTSYSFSGGLAGSPIGRIAVGLVVAIVFGLIAIYTVEWLSPVRSSNTSA
jgi:radical SAM superfamily enzyme YgiQ (UPF0313 family)